MLVSIYNHDYMHSFHKPHEYALLTLAIIPHMAELISEDEVPSLLEQMKDLIYQHASQDKNASVYMEKSLFFICEHIAEATELFEFFIKNNLFTKENQDFIMANAHQIKAILEIIKQLDQFSCLYQENLIQLARHENFTDLQNRFKEVSPQTAEACHRLLKKAVSLKNICLHRISQGFFQGDSTRLPLELQEAIPGPAVHTTLKTL